MTAGLRRAVGRYMYVKNAQPRTKIVRIIFVVTAVSAHPVQSVQSDLRCGRQVSMSVVVIHAAHPRLPARAGTRTIVIYAPVLAKRLIIHVGTATTVGNVSNAAGCALSDSRSVGNVAAFRPCRVRYASDKIVSIWRNSFYTIYNHVPIRSKRRTI